MAYNLRVKQLENLKDFLRIPSVSADPAHKTDVERAARWLEARLSGLGFEVEVVPTPGHPIVYAQKMVSPSAPTVLIYGHYDVQPPDPLELWHTPPFEPTIRDGRIYARGASDDKGQLYAHIAAVENLGPTLGVNVKFLIEGEEEVSSAHLEPFVRANRERLKADVLLISDGAMYAPGVPSLEYGLRGLVYMEVQLEGAARDLHSGTYGGAAPNPIHAAAWMIAKLKGEDGRILIPGFYDAVRPLSGAEKANLASLPFDADEFARSIGAEALPGEPGWGVLERTWVRPTLDVNGIWGGYQGEGSKTVIPAKAGFKFSMRLVPDQEPQVIQEAVTTYLHQILPEGYRMKILYHGTGKPVLTDLESPPMQAAMRALEQAWGRKPVFIRAGGSIPIVASFQELLGMPIVLMGMGLNDDNLHSPNEKFDLECFERGIQASENLLRLLARG